MPHQHLQALPVFAQLRLQQREAVDGGTMDSGQVGVVGFGAGVGGLAKALGGKRMNQACLELGTDKSIPDDMVITPGAFDGHEHIVQPVSRQSLADLSDGRIQFHTVVGHDRRGNQHLAVKVSQHPLGPCFGTVHTDNAEMFWTDLLDPGMKQTSGPVEDVGTPGSFAFVSCSNRHERLPPKKKTGYPKSPYRQSGGFSYL